MKFIESSSWVVNKYGYDTLDLFCCIMVNLEYIIGVLVYMNSVDNVKRAKSILFVNVEKLLLILQSIIIGIIMSLVFDSRSIFVGEVFSILLVLLLSNNIDRRSILVILGMKFIFLFFLLCNYYGNISMYGRPYFVGGSDDEFFEQTAKQFSQSIYKWPWDYPIDTNCNGMFWVLSILIKLSGGVEYYHTISYRLFNLNLLICIGEVAYKFAYKNIGLNCKQSMVVMTSIIAFPNAINLSTYVFRDTLCAFCILVGCAICNDLHTDSLKGFIFFRNKIMLVVILIADAVLSFWIRREALYLILVMFIISTLKNKINIKSLLSFLVIIIAGIYILYEMQAFSFIFAKIKRYLVYQSNYISQNNSSALYRRIFMTPMLPFGIIYRILYGLVFPLPTGILHFYKVFSSGLDMTNFLVSCGSCFQIIMLPFLLKGAAKINKYSLIYWVEFLAVIITTFTFRHFIIIYPFMFFVIYKEFYSMKKSERSRYLAIGVVITAILGTIYMLYKFF